MLAYPTKRFFSYLSTNKTMNKAAKKWGLKLGASQVVAGKTIEEAIEVIRRLTDEGLVCTIDHLGEFVEEETEAIKATEAALQILDKIAETGVACNLSIKLTKLGLDISEQLCLDNMRKIVALANKHSNFVRIDMEDYQHLEQTLSILRQLDKEFHNVSTVIQAYLYRSEGDVLSLNGHPLRLVKGAYREREEVAFQSKREIDKNYMKLIKLHLRNGNYTAIATHDHLIIEKVKKFVKAQRIPTSRFEFQFLYGFRPKLQRELVAQGYKVRVYVPFGEEWFGYFMRRLAERPQNVSFALKGLFSRK